MHQTPVLMVQRAQGGRLRPECKEAELLRGGYGYTTEYPMARLYADVRVARIYGGANEIMKLIIARAL